MSNAYRVSGQYPVIYFPLIAISMRACSSIYMSNLWSIFATFAGNFLQSASNSKFAARITLENCFLASRLLALPFRISLGSDSIQLLEVFKHIQMPSVNLGSAQFAAESSPTFCQPLYLGSYLPWLDCDYRHRRLFGSTSPSLCLFVHPLPHLLSVFPATRKMFHGPSLERFYNSGFFRQPASQLAGALFLPSFISFRIPCNHKLANKGHNGAP